MMYHGTTFERAISILKTGCFKGTKKLPHHQHSYISFSSSFQSANDFGEIVFTVSPSFPLFIEIEYESINWMRQNREIIEYVGVWYEDEAETQRELHAIQFEEEHVIKDEVACKEIVTEISIVVKEDEDFEEMLQQLQEMTGDIIPVHVIIRKERKPSDIEKKHLEELKQGVQELEEMMASLGLSS